MNWILDLLTHLYTPLGTTSNYSAIANLHISQITIAPFKPFPSLLCLQQLLTVEILQLPTLTSVLSGKYPTAELLSAVNCSTISSQPPLQSATELPTLN
jgi:hypothetical protein